MSKKPKPKHEDPALAAWFQSLSLADKYAAANYLKNTAGNARAALKESVTAGSYESSLGNTAISHFYSNICDHLAALLKLLTDKLEVLDPILKAAAPVKVKVKKERV